MQAVQKYCMILFFSLIAHSYIYDAPLILKSSNQSVVFVVHPFLFLFFFDLLDGLC
jgi:hypothetical protein